MASEKFASYQAYYTAGKWNKNMIHKATERGHLTAAEYKTITGEDYAPIIYKYEGGNLTDLMERHLITGDPNATSNNSNSNSGDSDNSDDPGGIATVESTTFLGHQEPDDNGEDDGTTTNGEDDGTTTNPENGGE